MPSISEVRGRTGEYLDNKEVECDLGKLWPFGMEGAEVALERGQERAERVEMRARRQEEEGCLLRGRGG